MPWLMLILVAVVAILGAFLNRIRGGYLGPLPDVPSSILLHNSLARALFAVPLGAAVFLAVRRRHALVLAIAVSLFTLLSLYVGWGAYFSMGRGDVGSEPRAGLFDAVLGSVQPQWSFWQRWTRDMAGMGLRGLVHTAVPGTLFYFYGYGSAYFLCGAFMGYDQPALFAFYTFWCDLSFFLHCVHVL